MCTGLEIAALAGSLATSAGGAYTQNQAQNRALRDQNEQISANNQRLTDQFAQRQAETNAARDALNQQAQQADAEQQALAKQKQQTLLDALNKLPINNSTNAVQQAADNRAATLAQLNDSPSAISFDATGPIGSGGPAVVQNARDKALAAASNETSGALKALQNIGALGDVNQNTSNALTSLGQNLDQTTATANAQKNIASDRIASLNRAIDYATNAPYSTVPVTTKPASSLAGDILTGLGGIGQSAVGAGLLSPDPTQAALLQNLTKQPIGYKLPELIGGGLVGTIS